MGYPFPLRMRFRDWLRYDFDPHALILNASAVDGSDFQQQHPIGISVFALPALPTNPADWKINATQTNLCSAMFQPGTAKKPCSHRLSRVRELDQYAWVTPRYWSLEDKRVTATTYMAQLERDKFTCSPRGHGVDCHRNYEAIICKCIPLITGADESLRAKYAELPVLIMDDYQTLSPEWLEYHYAQMLDTEYSFHHLTRQYWRWRRPDVDIDRQSRHWLQRYNRWKGWLRYLCALLLFVRPPHAWW